MICQCQKCGIRHIIADHTGLLNDTKFGRGNLQSYLEEKGRAGEMVTKSVPQLSDIDLKQYSIDALPDGTVNIALKEQT